MHPNQADQGNVGERHVGLEPELEVAEEEEEEREQDKAGKDDARKQQYVSDGLAQNECRNNRRKQP
jgi:hypothetical protein